LFSDAEDFSQEEIIPKIIIFFLCLSLVVFLMFSCALLDRCVQRYLPNQIKKLSIKIKNLLIYNALLRFLVMAYQGLVVNILIVILLYRAGKTEQVALICSLVSLVTLVIFLVWQYYFLKTNRRTLSHPRVKAQYGSLYKDIVVDRNGEKGGMFPLLSTTLHLMRRILTPVVVVLAFK
jgi:hypothetical protein